MLCHELGTNMADHITAIENEISRLDNQIMSLDKFDDTNTVSLNALVCLMKYAALLDRDGFKDWLKSKPSDINPTIMDRFVLFDKNKELGDKKRDGVQIRIHIMNEPGDEAKHNHQRSFITMCIQGGYKYEYHRINQSEEFKSEFKEIEVWNRIPQGDPPFEFEKKISGIIQQVDYESANDTGHLTTKGREFVKGDPPVFVNSNWHHVIIPIDSSPVITVVARRGKPQSLTTFIKYSDDPGFDPEKRAPVRNPSDDELEKMADSVISALTNGESIFRDDSNVVRLLMKSNGIIKVDKKYVNETKNLYPLKLFMEKNSFSYVPILDKGRYSGMGHCDDTSGELSFQIIENYPYVYESTSFLNAILWTVLSEEFIVPVLDRDNKFVGLLSIEDIVKNLRGITAGFFWPSENTSTAERKKFLIESDKLIQALIELDYFNGVREENYAIVNKILIHLGNLFFSKHISNLEISPSDLAAKEIQSHSDIGISPYLCPSQEEIEYDLLVSLLQEINSTSDISLLLTSKNKILDTATANEKSSSIVSGNSSIRSFLNSIVNGNWPALINTNEGLRLISTEELFDIKNISVLTEEIRKSPNLEAKGKLFDLYSKTDYTEEEFNSIPSLLRELID